MTGTPNANASKTTFGKPVAVAIFYISTLGITNASARIEFLLQLRDSGTTPAGNTPCH